MSTSTEAEGLDVDDNGHVLVKLSDIPSEQWKEAFREYWGTAGTVGRAVVKERGVLTLFRGDNSFSGH